MSAEITDRKTIDENSFINQELYRVFVAQSSEAIWRIELDEPISVSLLAAEQIEYFYRYGFLAECNNAMAKMYGYESADEIIGLRLGDFLVRENESNVEYLRAFINSNYRLEDAESHEVDREGNPKVFLNNLIGIIENGFVKRAWGTQRDITESKQAEESLGESQAILALSMQSSRMGVWTLDLATETVWWSEELEEIFGLKKGTFGGSEKEFFDFIHEDDREESWGEVQRAIAEQREYIIEFRFWHADSSLRWMEGRGKAVYSEKGEAVRLYGIGIDITERKKSEEKLRDREERYRTLFDSIDEGFCLLEMLFDDNGKPFDYRFLEVNPVFEQLTGLEKPVGKTALEMLPNLEARWFEIYGKVALTGESVRFTEGSDAMNRWFDVYALRVGGEESRKVALIFNNITEHKKAEEKLRESEEKFAKAFNSSPLALTISSLKTGKLIEVNETFIHATGYTREESVGRTTIELGLWDDSADRENELSAVQEMGEIRDLEYVFRLKDGTEIVGLLSAELLEIRGEPCALTVIQDITERRENEEVVRQSMKQLALVTDIAPVYIAHCDREKRFKFVNKAYAERFGMKPEDCIGKSISYILGETAFDNILDKVEVVLAGQPVEFEIEVPYPTIGNHFMHCSYAPEFDENGQVIGFVAAITDISERRKMEEAVRESEEQLRQMAGAMPQVVWISDADGVVNYYNNRVAEFYGVQQNSKGIWDWQPIIHSDDLSSTLRKWEKATEQKTGYAKEHRIQMADGNYRWHLSRAVPVLDANGEILKWYGTATDIHDIKQTEEALRESENRFRSMTNNAPMLVWISGTDKLATYFNQTWFDFTGRVLEDELGNGWTESIHEEDFDRFTETYSTAFDAREDFEMEYRLRRFDGEYRWILDKGAPLFTHNGTFKGYIGSCIDITDRKQGQEALLKAERRASEEYLELLSRIVPVAQTLGTARDLTSIYRALHEFVRISMPCTAFFVSSYNAENRLRLAEYVWGEEGEVDVSILPPMPLTENGGPNSQAIFQKKSVVVNRYWDLMKNRPHVVLQENGIDPNSSLVVPMTVMNRIIGTLEVQAYQDDAFTNEHIIALEMVGNLAAVAIENVRLLQVEADAREIAETANRAKDEFLSVLSHELRTPLNSILGWVRMLRAGVLDKEKTDKAIEVIERNALLQNNLIEDLLDVSRIISGKMRIEKEAVDLVKVFEDAVEILRPGAAQKNILFETNVAEKSLIINGDAMRFQQIMTNLVQNAIKFTAENGKVEVALSRIGNFARLVVKDNGIGISKEILPFIFERFRQADSSTKRAFSGLGLGLTIVRNLVELHGGIITAESAGSERGATFTVEIPLTEDFLETTASNSEAQIPSDINFVLQGARIMLVDDDVESLMPLQIFLEKEKAEIVTATSAKDALEKLSQENFHILITDIGMPFADGYDLIAKVRQLQTEQNAFITAIALTAYASSDDRRRALASGFQEHFAKPVDYDELLSTLKRIYEESEK